MENDKKVTQEKGLSELRYSLLMKIDESNHQNEKKILEAQLSISKAKVTFLFALFALFGIIYPLYISDKNTEKVDNSIAKMEERFKELAGEYLRKPEIVCEVNGEPLLNNTLIVANIADEESSQIFQIKNIGDASAGRTYVYLFIKDLPEGLSSLFYIHPFLSNINVMEKLQNDNPNFVEKYLVFISNAFHSKINFNMDFFYSSNQETGFDLDVPAMLQIHYNGPEPLEIPFTMKFISTKQQD